MDTRAHWSFTVYDNESRCLIDTGTYPDRSSRDDITKNSDGSTDLYFGPEAPAGKPAKNWVKTLPGKGWFTYFRLYGPTQSIAGVLAGSSPEFTLVGSASRIERLTNGCRSFAKDSGSCTYLTSDPQSSSNFTSKAGREGEGGVGKRSHHRQGTKRLLKKGKVPPKTEHEG